MDKPPALSLRGKDSRGRHETQGLTLESFLVTRAYKVFLFRSKRLQTSLAASGPWVTMAAIKLRQARAALHGDNGRSDETHRAPTPTVACCPPNQKREKQICGLALLL